MKFFPSPFEDKQNTGSTWPPRIEENVLTGAVLALVTDERYSGATNVRVFVIKWYLKIGALEFLVTRYP